MPLDRVQEVLEAHVRELARNGTAKGDEAVVLDVIPPRPGRGPRFRLAGTGDQEFLRMNSNSYLGLGLRADVVRAEEETSHRLGAGPGAVRFISGTYAPHVELEVLLAKFHRREAAMLFSAAYAAVVSVTSALTTPRTAIVSDELNHNSIINGIRLSRPASKAVYRHLDMDHLEEALRAAVGQADRVLLITDGIFSMRGDHAPLDRIIEVARRFDSEFPENVVVIVDDSHGVGAFGRTGRGVEEYTSSEPADVLVATLGKALGVNGGYVASSRQVVRFLRETAPMYIYSNPITAGEAAAALRALEILDSDEGLQLLERLRALTRRFEEGLIALGWEVIPGEHPVVPLMIRDTDRTRALVRHLKENGILATGLAYPVVPRGDEEIRFQVNADHTESDIDAVLAVLSAFRDQA